jgi:BMFP domain-containing protein YqiC
MTREELLRALYEPWGYDEPYDLIESAREQIEADGKRIAELEAAVRTLGSKDMSKDVTQEDRETAAKIFEHRGKFLMAEYVRAGTEDSNGIVQIVAAHRRASLAAAEARIAKLEGAFTKLEEEMRRYVLDNGPMRRLWALDEFGSRALKDKKQDSEK